MGIWTLAALTCHQRTGRKPPGPAAPVFGGGEKKGGGGGVYAQDNAAPPSYSIRKRSCTDSRDVEVG